MALLVDPTVTAINWKLPVSTLTAMTAILKRFYGTFSFPSADASTTLGKFKQFKFTFDVIRPLPSRATHSLPSGKGRYNQQQKEVITAEYKKRVALGIWEPDFKDPEYISYSHAVHQKGKWRTVIDFVKLNSCTRPATWPPNRIADVMYWLYATPFRFISSSDLKSAYHQIENDKSILRFLGIFTPVAVAKAMRMEFGHAQAVAYLAKAIFVTLRDIMWDKVANYFDDVVTKGRTAYEALDGIAAMLLRMERNGLKLSLDKSEWLMAQLISMGFVLSRDGVRPAPDRAEVFARWPKPKTAEQLQSFLGSAGYLRGLVPHYANLTEHLLRMMADPIKAYAEYHKKTLKKKLALNAQAETPITDEKTSLTSAQSLLSAIGSDTKMITTADGQSPSSVWLATVPRTKKTLRDYNAFMSRWLLKWNTEADAAFSDVCKKLSSGLFLAPFDDSQLPIVESDACEYCLGGVLAQERDIQISNDTHTPKETKRMMVAIAFYSRRFSDAERRLPIMVKELIAAVECCDHFSDFIQGRHFTHILDQKALLYLTSNKKFDARTIRLIQRLYEWQFATRVHRPGHWHSAADGVSRVGEPTQSDEFINPFYVTSQSFKVDQTQATPNSLAIELIDAQESSEDLEQLLTAQYDLVNSLSTISDPAYPIEAVNSPWPGISIFVIESGPKARAQSREIRPINEEDLKASAPVSDTANDPIAEANQLANRTPMPEIMKRIRDQTMLDFRQSQLEPQIQKLYSTLVDTPDELSEDKRWIIIAGISTPSALD